MNWIKNKFFIGRATRKQYWLTFLLLFFISLATFAVPLLVGTFAYYNEATHTSASTAVISQQNEDGRWEPIQTQQQTEVIREDQSSAPLATMFFGYVLGMIMMMFAFILPHIKRLHDLGHSGWFSLLMFVPVVGPLLWIGLIIYCGFFSGQPGENKYGPAPV